MKAFRTLNRLPLVRNIIRSRSSLFSHATSRPKTRSVAGLIFRNQVGLGAGFDKNARYLEELDAIGFGFVEVGTVTPLPQPGNPKPRLFRLEKDRALINRMGFNNVGVEQVAARIRQWKLKVDTASKAAGHPSLAGTTMLIGGNIGKNKATSNDMAWKDYAYCFRTLHDCVDYFVVNVSSPNTAGLRDLQEKEPLQKILTHLQQINDTLTHAGQLPRRPIFLKIAPDLDWTQMDMIADLAIQIGLDGLIICNTTTSREHLLTGTEVINKIGDGGLSGLPLKNRSTDILRYFSQKTNCKLAIIASGGVSTGGDARQKIEAGAALVQVWTGFIYEGPAIVRRIAEALSHS